MSENVYRIGDAAKIIGIKTSALRFWEEQFSQLRPKRTDKGQRYYSEKDMLLLKRIHGLLYAEGMTIHGVQKLFRKPTTPNNVSGHSVPISDPSYPTENTPTTPIFYTQEELPDHFPLSTIEKSTSLDCNTCDENAFLTAKNIDYINTLKHIQAELTDLSTILEVPPQDKSSTPKTSHIHPLPSGHDTE